MKCAQNARKEATININKISVNCKSLICVEKFINFCVIFNNFILNSREENSQSCMIIIAIIIITVISLDLWQINYI